MYTNWSRWVSSFKLSNTSPEYIIDQSIFLQDLSYTFSQYFYTLLVGVRQDVNNLESSVVVQELELAINLAYSVFIEFMYNQYNVGSLPFFSLSLTPTF